MNKADIAYPPGTAEFVLEHARWQKSRGRNPSVALGSIRDLRKALDAAHRQVIVKPKGGMRLSEAEIHIAAEFSGDASWISQPYDDLKVGDELSLVTEESQYEASRTFDLRLIAVVDGFQGLRGHETAHPRSKLFEAKVLGTDRDHVDVGSEVFGIFFPNGFSVLVDSGPDDDYTNRRIWAGITLKAG